MAGNKTRPSARPSCSSTPSTSTSAQVGLTRRRWGVVLEGASTLVHADSTEAP